VEENDAQDPIEPWSRIGGKVASELLSTRPGMLAKISPDAPPTKPVMDAPEAPSPITSSPIRAGGVLKMRGNPFDARSAFKRSRANLFGKTFLVCNIVLAIFACSASVGWERPRARGSGCCANIHPGSKNTTIGINNILIEM
jgi:hypothetical protein